MSTLTIQTTLWFRLADVIQDMGNHHPLYRETDAGRDLDILGNAIKFGVPVYQGAELDTQQNMLLAEAESVIAKHGGGGTHLSTLEQAIEVAEKLLGLWAE